MRNFKAFMAAVLSVILFAAPIVGGNPNSAMSEKEFDLLITNGRVVDGTGNPWFYADVAVKNGRVAEIGKIDAKRASRIIDASNKIVAPGFLDVHGHIEDGIEKLPIAENFLQMGVTSVITGNCGFSRTNLAAWFAKLQKQGISINVASLVGHNNVRREGMNGDFDRVPTAEELNKIREIVTKAMRDGAVGFSTGFTANRFGRSGLFLLSRTAASIVRE